MGLRTGQLQPSEGPPTPRQLAQLRRYFRAVMADAQSGDRMVAGLAPRLLVEDDTVTGLLRAATRTWRRVHKEAAAPRFSARTLAQALSPSTSLARQAGIMVDVFGLTTSEVGDALNRSVGEVTRLLSEARASHDRPIGGRVLVVDDEPMIAGHLAVLAQARGAREVVQARSYDEAVALAAAGRFDVALCDYDLGRGRTGLDVVRKLSSEDDTTCIFVTAYPDEVLSGSDFEPSFVIAKPFRDEVVSAALTYASAEDRPALLLA
jgi:CheY-like chemotaxis protein